MKAVLTGFCHTCGMIDGRLAFSGLMRGREGNFALFLAVLAPVLLGAVGGSMDLMALTTHRSALQETADAAALAAVHEASLKSWNARTAKSIALNVAVANYPGFQGGKAEHAIETTVDETSRTVSVTLIEDHRPYILGFALPSPQIEVSATARASGSTNVCVIGLDPNKGDTVGLEGKSNLTAPRCAVYSNSAAINGVSVLGLSKIVSDLNCSAGGYLGTPLNFSNLPVTDCPAIDDPLKDRPGPPVSSTCTATDLHIKKKSDPDELEPGVYCNGITIDGKAEVTMAPGIYVIKDGPLKLGPEASLSGRGVGFYFTGDKATFRIEKKASVDLEAPKSGDMAGLLFYQAHGSKEEEFMLRGGANSNLLGTIYLPNGDFVIDTNSKVASSSAYTVIVARKLTLRKRSNVVLNTDYSATDVPVPEGLGPTKGEVQLIR